MILPLVWIYYWHLTHLWHGMEAVCVVMRLVSYLAIAHIRLMSYCQKWWLLAHLAYSTALRAGELVSPAQACLTCLAC